MNFENLTKRIAQVVIISIAMFVALFFFTSPIVRLFTECVGSVDNALGNLQNVCSVYRTWFIIEFVLSPVVFYLSILFVFVALLFLAVELKTEQPIFGHIGVSLLSVFFVILAFRMVLQPFMQESDFYKTRTNGF